DPNGNHQPPQPPTPLRQQLALPHDNHAKLAPSSRKAQPSQLFQRRSQTTPSRIAGIQRLVVRLRLSLRFRSVLLDSGYRSIMAPPVQVTRTTLSRGTYANP